MYPGSMIDSLTNRNYATAQVANAQQKPAPAQPKTPQGVVAAVTSAAASALMTKGMPVTRRLGVAVGAAALALVSANASNPSIGGAWQKMNKNKTNN